MPRKKTEVIPAAGELVPVSYATTRATRKNLIRIQEKAFLSNAEAMLEESYAVLRKQIRSGSMKAVEMAFELHGMIKTRAGGTTLNNYIMQANSNRADANSQSSSATSFDSLVRKLDARGSQSAQARDVVEVVPG